VIKQDFPVADFFLLSLLHSYLRHEPIQLIHERPIDGLDQRHLVYRENNIVNFRPRVIPRLRRVRRSSKKHPKRAGVRDEELEEQKTELDRVVKYMTKQRDERTERFERTTCTQDTQPNQNKRHGEKAYVVLFHRIVVRNNGCHPCKYDHPYR